MNFVIDEQLPPALADWVSAQGHAAVHVRDVGLRAADDMDVWRHCMICGAVVLTKDEDFPTRRNRSEEGPQVLWIRLGNAANDVLLAWLAPRWTEAIEALEGGAPLVELR
jgi:predicted nuclease of predicted toxin-antitoxin system